MRQAEVDILRKSEELASSQTLLAQARHREAELSKRVSYLSQKILRLSDESYENLDFLGSVFCARHEAAHRVSFGDTHRNEVSAFTEQPDTVVVLSQAPQIATVAPVLRKCIFPENEDELETPVTKKMDADDMLSSSSSSSLGDDDSQLSEGHMLRTRTSRYTTSRRAERCT